jgi:hypothetical protein
MVGSWNWQMIVFCGWLKNRENWKKLMIKGTFFFWEVKCWSVEWCVINLLRRLRNILITWRVCTKWKLQKLNARWEKSKSDQLFWNKRLVFLYTVWSSHRTLTIVRIGRVNVCQIYCYSYSSA